MIPSSCFLLANFFGFRKAAVIFAKPSAHQRTFRDRLIDLITVRKHKETTLASGHDMCHRYRSDLRKVGKLVHYSKPGYDHPLG